MYVPCYPRVRRCPQNPVLDVRWALRVSGCAAFALEEYTEHAVAELSNQKTSTGLLRVGNYCKWLTRTEAFRHR